MKFLVVLSVLLAAAYARPEPPVGGGGNGFQGYSSPSAPSGTYGVPSRVYGAVVEQPTIHKHVYVHVPPPEEPEYEQRRPIQQGVPQKHYKIIFIKAPSPPKPTAPVLPPPVQNEEKTLVYVLVKRPEETADIIIPTAAPTPPSKPEVYFIRYKTQKEEGYADSGVPQNQYGAPAPQPSSEYGAPGH